MTRLLRGSIQGSMLVVAEWVGRGREMLCSLMLERRSPKSKAWNDEIRALEAKKNATWKMCL